MGTTGTKLNPVIIHYLTAKIPINLISLDNDQGGREKTTELMKQLPNAIDWPVPEKHGKDPGDAWKRISLQAWVKSGLKHHSTLNKNHSLTHARKG